MDRMSLWKERLRQAKQFTQAYASHEHDDPYTREAECLRAQYPAVFCDIQEGDRFAGRVQRPLCGFIQSYDTGEIGYICRDVEMKQAIERGELSEEDVPVAEELMRFWSGRQTMDDAARRIGPHDEPWLDNALLPAGQGIDWKCHVFVGNYMFRLAEINLDFDLLLRLGLDGLMARIDERDAANVQAQAAYGAMRAALRLVQQACLYYAGEARRMAAAAKPDRRLELMGMAEDLAFVSGKPPEHLAQAIQLFWLYAQMAYLDNFGRMDEYLGDFYVRDIESGYLSEEQAIELIYRLFALIDEQFPTSGRVVIGGLGRRNAESADRFALGALEAQRRLRGQAPSLSMRVYAGMNAALFQKAMDVIAEGGTYPMLYNDDCGVPAIERAFGVSREDAEQYVMSNCGEYGLAHRAVCTPSGSVNYVKLLEVTLNNGVDPVTKRPMLLKTGEFESFDSFDAFFDAYLRQARFFVSFLARAMDQVYAAMEQGAPNLLASLLHDDCVARGKGLMEGARYRGLIVETHGLILVADSLLAIKKLVYEEKAMTAGEMLEMLNRNFVGGARARKRMLDVPKYGNDQEEADQMVLRVYDAICRLTAEQAQETSFDFVLPSHISVDGYVYMGRNAGATPDGRMAGQPVTNSNNPLAGNDRNGITALLNSMAKVKPNGVAGQVNHLKISPRVMREKRALVEGAVKTFFEAGGNYLCISVLGKQDLLNALDQPERYGNLMVRIGGYSARFVSLPPELKEDIIARTEY